MVNYMLDNSVYVRFNFGVNVNGKPTVHEICGNLNTFLIDSYIEIIDANGNSNIIPWQNILLIKKFNSKEVNK